MISLIAVSFFEQQWHVPAPQCLIKSSSLANCRYRHFCCKLFYNCADNACADCTATLADRKTKTFVHRNRGDQVYGHGYVVTGHYHLNSGRKLRYTGHVGCPEVELRAVPVEERGVATAFLFGQYIRLSLEFGVRGDAARLGKYLAALDLFTLDAAKKGADVVACTTFVKKLAAHLYAGDGGLGGLLDADYLYLFANLDYAALNTAGGYGAAAGDGEYVFDRHEERLVNGALGLGDVAVYGFHETVDGVFAKLGLLAVQRLKGGTLDYGNVVAGEVIAGKKLADLKLDKLEKLGVVYHVCFVEVYYYVRHAYLTGKKDVLPGLRHGTVGCGYNEDRSVHLCCAGDHVLDVVGVARTVYVGIVTVVGLIFYMGGGYGYAALTLFRGVVNLVKCLEYCLALGCKNLGYGSSKGRLAVVYVTNRANVYMRFRTLKFRLSHKMNLLWSVISVNP